MSEKQVSKKTLLKTGFWYTLSMFLTRGIAFITTPIFTRLMTQQQYGDFTVFASWQAILLTVCGLELEGTINRARFDYPEKKEMQSYISSALILSTLLVLFIFALYLVFPQIFDQLFLIDRKYMYVMFAYLLTCPAIRVFQTTQRIEYKYKTSSAVSISMALASPLFGVALVLLMKNDPLYGRIIGQFFPYIACGLIFYIYFFSQNRTVSVSKWKYALRMGLPLVVSYLCSRIMLLSDTIVVKHLCTAEQVSYLSVSHSSSHIITTLVSTLNIAWAPWFYDMLKVENYREIRQTYRMYLWLMVAFTFAIILIGPEIIMVLGGKNYKESVFTLPGYVLCGIFTVLTSQFVNLEIYHKKPEYAAILTGIVAALNIILDIVGVKIWGYMAACYATVFCQLVLIGLHYIVSQRLGVRDILSIKILVMALAVSIAFIPVALLLYQSNMIRYGFTALVAIIAAMLIIKKKEKIMAAVHKIRSEKDVQKREVF